jgi:hypothetical protein
MLKIQFGMSDSIIVESLTDERVIRFVDYGESFDEILNKIMDSVGY